MAEKPEEMQQKLRENEERYRLLVESSSDTIWTVNLTGQVTYISPSVERLTGYSRAEAMERSLAKSMTPESEMLVREDMKRIVAEAGTGARPAPKRLVLEFLRKDGSTVWAETTSSGRFDTGGRLVGFQGLTRDITEIGQMVEAIRERNQLKTLLNFYRQADARIQDIEAFVVEECIRISASTLAFFGFINEDETLMRTHFWSRRAMEGCTIDYKPVEFSLPHAGIWAEAIRTHAPLIVNDYLKPDSRKKGYPDGHVPIQRLLSIPIVKGAKAVALIAVANKKTDYSETDVLQLSLFVESMWDMLKRKKAEEELRKLNEDLEDKVKERTDQLIKAQEELIRKEKLAVLGRLAGTVGHELRNPLGVMNNAVYFLKTIMSDADHTVKEYLDMIEQEIGSAEWIIADLLDFSRTKMPEIKSTAVGALLANALTRCPIPENVNVVTDIPDTTPMVNIDPFQMGQVFQNLITNAVQAMPGGGTLRISARHVQSSINLPATPFDKEGSDLNVEHGTPDQGPGQALNVEPDADFVEISVEDTGEGISPENMEKLFQPLFTTKAKGIGLGLVVCKNLVEANGGKIEVESGACKGTTFRLLLPAEASRRVDAEE